MNLFTWILVGHLVGDFLLQTNWMAMNKAENWSALITHCTIYTATVALFALPAGGLALPGIVIIFLGHIIIDRRKLVHLWAKYVSRAPEIGWFKIVQDQVWHIIFLTLATLF